jgi:uncharacterized membrane protein
VEWIQGKALGLLVSAIPVGTIAFLAYQGLKRYTQIVANLPAWAHRLAVTGTAGLVLAVTALAGVPIICEPGTTCIDALTQDKLAALIKWALASGSAFVIHAGRSSKAARGK